MERSAPSENFGPFWERKMRTRFNVLDADGDGVITSNDFKIVARRWAEVANLNETEANELREKLEQHFMKHYNSDGKPISFADHLERMKKEGKEKLITMVTNFSPRFFPVIDTDKDGFVDAKEFEDYFRIFGLSAEAARETFRHLDLNHDGKITEEEHETALINFYQLEHEGDPSQHMWGPLVPE